MKIVIDKNAPRDVLTSLQGFGPEIGGLACGTFCIKTDDDVLISVIVVSENDAKYSPEVIQSAIYTSHEHTNLVYTAIIGNASNGILLSLQEFGSFTAVLQSYNDIVRLVKFISDPKRRLEKKLRPVPVRNVHFFTPGEQMLLAVPGTGPKKIGALLTHFGGSIAWALAAMTWKSTADELAHITEKDIEDFRTMLCLEEDQILSVVDKESLNE